MSDLNKPPTLFNPPEVSAINIGDTSLFYLLQMELRVHLY